MKNDSIETLVARVADLDYTDVARMESEARRLRAEVMRGYVVQAYRWLTGLGRRSEAKSSVGANPRHA